MPENAVNFFFFFFLKIVARREAPACRKARAKRILRFSARHPPSHSGRVSVAARSPHVCCEDWGLILRDERVPRLLRDEEEMPRVDIEIKNQSTRQIKEAPLGRLLILLPHFKLPSSLAGGEALLAAASLHGLIGHAGMVSQ